MDRNGSYQIASPPRQRAFADSVVAQPLETTHGARVSSIVPLRPTI
jgi:hypothetical protein